MYTVNPEPVPMAFACGAALLAAGFSRRPSRLSSALAGAVALLYDPIIAAPFWAIVVLAFFFDRQCRHILRPILPILLVAVLLLANLAQLQPQIATEQTLFARLSTSVAELQQFRTPYAWFSPWRHEIVAVSRAGGFRSLGGSTRMAAPEPPDALACAGNGTGRNRLGVLLYLLVDRARLAIAAALQPSRMLVFTVLFTSLLCALAAIEAVTRRRRWEAFGLVRPGGGAAAECAASSISCASLKPGAPAQLALCLALAGLLTWAARSTRLMPIAFLATMPALRRVSHSGRLISSDESQTHR